MSRIVITGPSGGTPNRLEINDFIKNEKFFSLYIQALQRMQNIKQDDYQSFFQVGGIHGIPYKAWDGAESQKHGRWEGYCTHSSVLFPTWHRPYVLLYEQLLQKQAIAIASTYTVSRADWIRAAENLRQPYWDWASNSVPPAEVISKDTVFIIGPTGAGVNVNNPLLEYQFNPVPPEFKQVSRFQYPDAPITLRHPRGVGASATSNVDRLIQTLGFPSTRESIRTDTYKMLTQNRTWDAFSNTSRTVNSIANSLEGVHNNIHGLVGGGGHMNFPAVAGFDPIFYLHHTNVDRMLSLWAALNPGVWVSPGNAQNGTFTVPANSVVNATTPLTPFWNSQTTFWASSATTDTSRLGYTYPEFNGLDMGNPQSVRTAIGRTINRLYGSAAVGVLSAEPDAIQVAAEDTAAFTAPPNHGLYDWVVRIQYKKFELGTSFFIPIFFGSVPEDPNDWLISSTLVGAHHAFVNENPEDCANCQSQADLVEEGFVHLNGAIAAMSGLNSLEHDVVAPYLTKELQWKVIKANGELAELESLEVHVMSTPLEYPTLATFPVDGTPRHHPEITAGRRNGSRQA